MLELADIARPGRVREGLHGLGGDRLEALAQLPRVVTHEVAHQERNIFRPLAQRRDQNGKDMQPVIDIGAELPFRHRLPRGYQTIVKCTPTMCDGRRQGQWYSPASFEATPACWSSSRKFLASELGRPFLQLTLDLPDQGFV